MTATSELTDLDYYRMANLFPRTTGLPFVVWISSRQEVHHDARVKVSAGVKSQPLIASIAIRPDIRVTAGEMKNHDFRLLARWIELNRDVLIRYWDEEIDTAEVIGGLRPLSV